GKSTVVNFLAGAVVAEANPQAGYTRHPSAYLPAGPAFNWPSYIGFMGPLQRLSGEKPADADEDVYQVKRIPGAAAAPAESPLAVPVIAFPQRTARERLDPAGAGAKHRVQLLNQILVQCDSDTATRLRTVTNAAKYLATAGEGLLEVARRDLAELEAWKASVM